MSTSDTLLIEYSPEPQAHTHCGSSFLTTTSNDFPVLLFNVYKLHEFGFRTSCSLLLSPCQTAPLKLYKGDFNPEKSPIQSFSREVEVELEDVTLNGCLPRGRKVLIVTLKEGDQSVVVEVDGQNVSLFDRFLTRLFKV
ncbi:hypothetical protein P9112_008229 [Eukaryota sp. TZLM1-RC]